MATMNFFAWHVFRSVGRESTGALVLPEHVLVFASPLVCNNSPSWTMVTTDGSDILLHPDALRCLKRKQLESLCQRLDVKATGKVSSCMRPLRDTH